jgi:ubiquinone/menaquinone biosynthesis C-methylase UbiE
MGCAHKGISDISDYGLVVKKIKQCNPEFVLFLGGMVDGSTNKSLESLWQEFDLVTSQLGVPIYNVTSNCTLMPSSIGEDRKALMVKCFLDRYKKRYYSFEHKNNLFICLDSENLLVKNKSGLPSMEQIEFLDETLRDTSKYNNVFIALNRSPWFEEDNTGWFKFIHSLINKKVKYVFGASKHFIKIKTIDEVNYVTSGCPKVKTAMHNSFFPHFLTVDITAKKVDITVVPFVNLPINFFKKDKDNDETKDYSVYYYSQKVFKPDILNSQERIAILDPARIIETLKIKPGMNIVDVGAGTGLFAFPMADRLKGTGKVFATDIDPTMIEHMNVKAKKGKYKNVVPVKVTSRGLDNFYKNNSFDIIFLCNVYDSILHPKEYFQELRPSLQKNKGSLYIIHFKNVSDFSEVEFGDFKKIVQVLKSEGAKFPIYKRLDREAQGFINNWVGQDVPANIRNGIIEDFNKILMDRFLLVDLLDYYGGQDESDRKLSFEELLYPYDVRLALWLYASLDGKGIFEHEEMIVSDQDFRELKKLNRILIAGIFQNDTLFWITTRRPIVNRESIVATLKAAGYELVQSYDFLTQYDFLEFK